MEGVVRWRGIKKPGASDRDKIQSPEYLKEDSLSDHTFIYFEIEMERPKIVLSLFVFFIVLSLSLKLPDSIGTLFLWLLWSRRGGRTYTLLHHAT